MRRLSKMPSDPNEAAALTVKLATGESAETGNEQARVSAYLAKIGRKGGIKGGKARAAALTKAQRTEIARKAAKARWASKKASATPR